MRWLSLRDPLPLYPWSWLDQMDQFQREMEALFERTGEVEPQPTTSGVYPPLSLYETPEAFVVRAEVPGLEREDIGVSIEGKRLTLAGKRTLELPEGTTRSWQRREQQAGVFRRTLELSQPVDAEKIAASYRHGVLEIRLPKTPEHQPRQIEVRVA